MWVSPRHFPRVEERNYVEKRTGKLTLRPERVVPGKEGEGLPCVLHSLLEDGTHGGG